MPKAKKRGENRGAAPSFVTTTISINFSTLRKQQWVTYIEKKNKLLLAQEVKKGRGEVIHSNSI